MVEQVVFDSGCAASQQINDLIHRLGIPVCGVPADDTRRYLTTVAGALSLVEGGRPGFKPLSVDFVRERRKHRSLPIPKRGPLARALGKGTRTVIDATAGWGRDMFLMWLMGYDVVAVERSAVVGALLLDGLERLEQYEPGPIYPGVEVTEATGFLARHNADCVYLDPMFAPRKKASPLAKRPLRVLRELVGDDDDRSQLFDAAWQAASSRIVVKRPNHAKPWRAPDQSFSGKIMTYDLYLKIR